MTTPSLKLLDQVRAALRRKHYSYRTEQSYIHWIKRYVRFHHTHHPRTLGSTEIVAFLSHLAVDEQVAASTQNQALSALLFLYRDVLELNLHLTLDAVRAKRPKRLPTVLTPDEVAAVFAHLSGVHSLMAQLLYGSGLRLMECLRIRIKDIDVAQRQIIVRDGKGMQDRVTMLPERVLPVLQAHLQQVHHLHQQDLARGYGAVYLPFALERKYPHANREWAWQYVFSSDRLSRDPRASVLGRHHASERALQEAVRRAAQQSGLTKRVSCHTFRHSVATHLLQNGYDIRTGQELLGHKDVKTTMIYTHVLHRGVAVRSPLDPVA